MQAKDILEMIQDLTGIKNKPAAVETQMKLQLIELHASANFYRDKVVSELDFGESMAVVEFNLTQVLPGFRKFASIVDQYGKPLRLATADYVMSNPNNTKGRYWVAGNTVNIKLQTFMSRITVAYYAHPQVNPLQDTNSWILLEYPMVLAYKVAKVQAAGDNALFQQMQAAFAESYAVMLKANLEPDEHG